MTKEDYLKTAEFRTPELLLKNKKLFETSKNQIESNGFFLVNNYKVFTPELAACFTIGEIEYLDYRFMTITGKDLFDIYTKGYDDGIKKYIDEWNVGPNVVFSDNFKLYMKGIKKQLKEWESVKKFYPLILNYKSIYKAGLNAGMLTEFYKFKAKYPRFVK